VKTATSPPRSLVSRDQIPEGGPGREAIAGIGSGAVSFLVIPILFGPLGILLGLLGLARGERRLCTMAVVVSVLGLGVGFILSFLVLCTSGI
jgi:hypothetical protein